MLRVVLRVGRAVGVWLVIGKAKCLSVGFASFPRLYLYVLSWVPFDWFCSSVKPFIFLSWLVPFAVHDSRLVWLSALPTTAADSAYAPLLALCMNRLTYTDTTFSHETSTYLLVHRPNTRTLVPFQLVECLSLLF